MVHTLRHEEHTNNNAASGHFTDRITVLEGGKSKSVAIGAYSNSEKTPRFDITAEPAVANGLDVALERLDIPGRSRYAMICRLRNLSEETCKVTIRRQEIVAA